MAERPNAEEDADDGWETVEASPEIEQRCMEVDPSVAMLAFVKKETLKNKKGGCELFASSAANSVIGCIFACPFPSARLLTLPPIFHIFPNPSVVLIPIAPIAE